MLLQTCDLEFIRDTAWQKQMTNGIVIASLSTFIYSNLFFGGCIKNIGQMNVWRLAREAQGSF